MRTRLGVIVVFAAIAASCGGGDVSQAEFDQKLSELALAQQDLVAARDTIAQLEGVGSNVDAALDDMEAAVLEALGLRGVTVDPGVGRVDALAGAVAATTEERDQLLEALEGGSGEFGSTLDTARLDGLLSIAAAMQDWARPTGPPETVDEFASVAVTIDEVGDEMVSLAFEALLEGYPDADPAERTALLLDVAAWAVDIARSSLAG